MRREPTQQRARERVDHMLYVAERLMIEKGVGNLKINEIADAADVPIGSVYRYFSGREEILRGIADRHHANLEETIRALFATRRDFDDLVAAVDEMLDAAWHYVASTPGYREILCGVQAWEILRELDWKDTIANAQLITAAFKPYLANIAESRLIAFFTIVCDAGGSTARLAVAFSDMGDELLLQFRSMAKSYLTALAAENRAVEIYRAQTA